MATLVHQGFYVDVEAGNVTDAVDLRCLAVMTNTTADTETDATNLDAFTTLDELDGTGYSRADLANVVVTYSSGTMTIDCDDFDLDGGGDSIAVSTRDIQGIIFYRYVDGTDANDVPWFYVDVGPFTPAGGAFDVTVNANGIATVAKA